MKSSKTLARVIKYLAGKKGKEETERAIRAAAISICRCEVRGMIVQVKQVEGDTCQLLKSGYNASPGLLRQRAF